MKRASSRITKLFGTWTGWLVFAVIAYVASMYLTSLLMYILVRSGLVAFSDVTSYALFVRVLLYGLLIAIFLLLPKWLNRSTTRREVGLGRGMEWKDIGVGVAGVVTYFLLAIALLSLARLIPGFDASQTQELEVGPVYGLARMMTFIVLVVLTPFAEEFLFRGVLYGGLRSRRVKPWVAALVVSVLFGVAHGQLNVGIDVFCLSLVACYAREATGSIWAGVVLHMIKNLIAFALVFVVGQV